MKILNSGMWSLDTSRHTKTNSTRMQHGNKDQRKPKPANHVYKNVFTTLIISISMLFLWALINQVTVSFESTMEMQPLLIERPKKEVLRWIFPSSHQMQEGETCNSTCKVPFGTAGYPIAISTNGTFNHFIGADVFRDMADFVFYWNFANEFDDPDLFSRSNMPLVARCLGPVPLIYSKADYIYILNFEKQLLPHLRTPFILVTGQSDYSSPHARTVRILKHNTLLHWFGQNPMLVHPKFTPIPIGIKINRHANLLTEAMKNYSISKFNLSTYAKALLEKYKNGYKSKLLLLQFSKNTFPRRKLILQQLCNKSFVSCLNKSSTENYYSHQVEYPFVLSPRGHGLDCFRSWETLYLRRIPVLESSLLDPLFHGLPVLIVKNFITDVTESTLLSALERFSKFQLKYEKLHPEYWRDLMEKKRSESLQELNINTSNYPPRYRCWGA